MQTKLFGETGLRVAAIGLGTTGMGTRMFHSEEYVKQRIQSLQVGIDLGLTFIDTASLYGNGFSEEVVGFALKGKREKCFLATKFYPNEGMTAKDVRLGLEASLRRLQTDWIDLYQVHWPNPRANMGEIFGMLEEYTKTGVIGHIGICNYSLQQVHELSTIVSLTNVISNEIELNLQVKKAGCEFLGSSLFKGAILAYSPLNQGRITATKGQAKLLEFLAEKYEATPAQIVLAWLSSLDRVFPIVKAGGRQHLEENAAAMELTLSKEDILAISDVWEEKVTEVLPEKIKLRGTVKRKPYCTMEEALENPLDLIPSPAELAESIVQFGLKLPIRVNQIFGAKDQFEYEIDSYDPFDQVKKYWAWRIAFPKSSISIYLPKAGQYNLCNARSKKKSGEDSHECK